MPARSRSGGGIDQYGEARSYVHPKLKIFQGRCHFSGRSNGRERKPVIDCTATTATLAAWIG
jgi:hypothetical protein